MSSKSVFFFFAADAKLPLFFYLKLIMPEAEMLVDLVIHVPEKLPKIRYNGITCCTPGISVVFRPSVD